LAQVDTLIAENAALRERLKLPPKMPGTPRAAEPKPQTEL
jgi:hypothetical protein